MKNISNQIEQIQELINNSDYILIGAGAGLSTSAGIEYSGKRFEENFADFIKKYHFTDMYTSSFYDFETEEEKWAYWARHIYTNNTGRGPTKLYQDILKLVKDKKYFVITTNVDDQFYKAGFDKEKIFAVQGSYSYIQCSVACHNKLYDDTEIVNKMLEKTVDCKIPTELVTKCPVSGGPMDVNIRKDAYFVQDDNWYKQSKNYENFLEETKDKKVVLLEFGVGFNTPGIIRFPFEQMTLQNENCKLDTKDAFWHSKNVTVRDSIVKGEYLAWFSDGLILINCKIIGTQPLCYCKNLKLINCTMEDTDLAFEYSEVEADIKGNVISIKNPKSGTITVDSVGEIINEDSIMDVNGKVIIRNEK